MESGFIKGEDEIKTRSHSEKPREKAGSRDERKKIQDQTQKSNHQVKNAMALELAELGLSREAIERILNIHLPMDDEDDIPF